MLLKMKRGSRISWLVCGTWIYRNSSKAISVVSIIAILTERIVVNSGSSRIIDLSLVPKINQ